jgi:hypothetical protein
MQPEVLPLRIFFVPHWKYLDSARLFRLHVPTGFASVMFTHLPSRTVFIDTDRYMGEEWLGHWMAHELGHLATNSVNENDADKAAREYRRRLKKECKRGHSKAVPTTPSHSQAAIVQGHSRPEILAAAVFFSSPLISFSRDCVLNGLA